MKFNAKFAQALHVCYHPVVAAIRFGLQENHFSAIALHSIEGDASASSEIHGELHQQQSS